MPGYDGTGPAGSGPNGRGMGPCGRGMRGTNRGFFGFGRRGDFGRGFLPLRWLGVNPVNDEKTQLDSEKEWLSQQLEAVKRRLNDLESKE